jgi:uncharacterized membrane protein
MKRGRLEAFSDGVIAILITIMVLELRVPHGTRVEDLAEAVPHLLTYLLSFAYLGIYWNNHHHMLHTVERVNGAILWTNLHLLFWLSLIPYATAYLGENHAASLPSFIYGVVLLLAAAAYTMLQGAIIRSQGPDSRLAALVKSDYKGKLSILLYTLGVVCAYFFPLVSLVIYTFVAAIWFVPDQRIEKHLDVPVQ